MRPIGAGIMGKFEHTLAVAAELIVAVAITGGCGTGYKEAATQAPPRNLALTGALEGARNAVFQTPEESCEETDIPDAMARAFRDYKGMVHLIASHYVMRQSIGRDLLNVKHGCRVAFRSVHDANPALFNDAAWLDSFYTLDGKTVLALAHMEYHGSEHDSTCRSKDPFACEFDADTFFISADGGYKFKPLGSSGPPISIPYRYQAGRGPAGYSVDTNIVKSGNWYYAMVTAWAWPPNCTAEPGPQHCLIPAGGSPIRTSNLLDPSSWRGWNGRDYSVSFIDPYHSVVERSGDHIMAPVANMDFVTAINIYEPANLYVATLWDGWDERFGPKGLFLSTSNDMIHWSKPALIVTQAKLLAEEPKGKWSYAYFSLLDPQSKDRNFSTIGDHPFLYYVRLDEDNPPTSRVLFRQEIVLGLSQ